MPATNVAVTRDKFLEAGLHRQFDAIKSNPDYIYNEGTQGIIYVGGGKYWPGIMVGIRMLRMLGSNLPVEIWYREGVETVYPEDIDGLNVTLHPIPLPMGGWEAKLYALYHTRLHYLMYLDADAYVTANPHMLFALLCEETPFIYWQDLPSQNNSIRWQSVYPEGASKSPKAVQGGQLLFDREYAWKLIHTSKYMCDNSTFYFKRMYGDQDTWRVALAGGVCPYLCLGHAEWDRIAFRCKYAYILHVVHRCKGKLFTPEHIPVGNRQYANPHYDYPFEVDVFNFFAEYVNKRNPVHASTFDTIYTKQIWDVKNSSGRGSEPKEAQEYIQFVNNLIASNGYQTVVDVGCGNGIVGNLIKCKQYSGYDCSEVIIKQCRKKFSRNAYFHIDISSDYGKIDGADVLLCKDVLHHWPSETVTRFIDYITGPDRRWEKIILCFDRKQIKDGQDCYPGGYRALSVDMEPLKKFGFHFTHTFLHKGIILI